MIELFEYVVISVAMFFPLYIMIVLYKDNQKRKEENKSRIAKKQLELSQQFGEILKKSLHETWNKFWKEKEEEEEKIRIEAGRKYFFETRIHDNIVQCSECHVIYNLPEFEDKDLITKPCINCEGKLEFMIGQGQKGHHAFPNITKGTYAKDAWKKILSDEEMFKKYPKVAKLFGRNEE